MNKKLIQSVSLFLLVTAVVWGTANREGMVYAAASEMNIEVIQDHLTMKVHDALLVEVVERVTQILLLTSHVDPDLEKMLVTLTLKDVPYREGLAKLLANTNYVLTDRDLYVWARGESPKSGQWRERKQETPLQEPEEQPEISGEDLRYQALHGKDPEARATALELLSSENEEIAISTLADALNDQSPEVRELALELLGETEGPLPIDQIAKMVTDDPNPERRMEAIVVLASRDEEAAKTILQNALHDSDPEVVELAISILQEVDSNAEDEDLR